MIALLNWNWKIFNLMLLFLSFYIEFKFMLTSTINNKFKCCLWNQIDEFFKESDSRKLSCKYVRILFINYIYKKLKTTFLTRFQFT